LILRWPAVAPIAMERMALPMPDFAGLAVHLTSHPSGPALVTKNAVVTRRRGALLRHSGIFPGCLVQRSWLSAALGLSDHFPAVRGCFSCVKLVGCGSLNIHRRLVRCGLINTRGRDASSQFCSRDTTLCPRKFLGGFFPNLFQSQLHSFLSHIPKPQFNCKL